MHVAFVCSNATHIHTFAPVIAKLSESGVHSTLLSLEEYYGGDLGAVAAAHGVRAVMVRRRSGPLVPNAFYARSVSAIWRDVLVARRDVAAVLDEISPAAVVVGNDFGLMEKVTLRVARQRGARRVLVQDGRLTARRPREDEPTRRLLRLAKSVLSPALRLLGLPELAASEYGQGDVDVICVTSRDSQLLLRQRARKGTHVVLTGQPRYASATHGRGASPGTEDNLVTMFTTPFAVDRLSKESQHRQVRLAADLSERLSAARVTFLVKPHPREDAAAYRSAGLTTVDEMPAALLARSWVAIVGISTVIEEAALAGVPLIVPGRVVHGSRFDHQMPPADIYPWFESSAEACELLDGLRDPSAWQRLAERQRASVLGELVATVPPDLAAAAVAAQIVGRR
ncbi:MAG: hypothetical protein WD402_10295 [Chloroflexota bacterium]